MGWGYKIKSHNGPLDYAKLAPEDTELPDCAFIRFGHNSCTRNHCHAALLKVDQSPDRQEISSHSHTQRRARRILRSMWGHFKNLGKKNQNQLPLSNDVMEDRSMNKVVMEPTAMHHAVTEQSVVVSSPLNGAILQKPTLPEAMVAKRVLLESRQRLPPTLQLPTGAQPHPRTHLQSDHGSFTSVSMSSGANSSAISRPTWTSSKRFVRQKQHEQRVSWSSIDSNGSHRLHHLYDYKSTYPVYYQPIYSSTSTSTHPDISLGSQEWQTPLSVTSTAPTKSYCRSNIGSRGGQVSAQKQLCDPYRHQLQQRRILIGVLRELHT
ncbi:hypothetical protein BGZ94_009374 [Podila epigama]|nr:hypothetical protein BGZ94_009374 [Podila epigama]